MRLPLSDVVRDLDVLLEADLMLTRHARHMDSRKFWTAEAYSITALRGSRTTVVCFVVTKVHRCNSLLTVAHRHPLASLQSVLNAAARLVCNRRKIDH